MENSHKKELNISGRKNNESFPFTIFFQIIVACAVDFITQQSWTSEKKKTGW